MALVRWALIGLMAVTAAAAWVYFARTGHEATERSLGQDRLPDAPFGARERAGSGPICGMDLLSIASLGEGAKGGVGAHAHGDAPAAAGKYWCPMHPEVASDDPNAICEKCGSMKLIPREQVPGLTAVEVSQERLQLIGMRTATAVVERLAPTLRTVGMVAPDEGAVAVVTSRVTGWVEKVMVSQSGERVKKGQALAQIHSLELNSAQINYLNAIKWTRDWSAGQSQQGTQALEARCSRSAR